MLRPIRSAGSTVVTVSRLGVLALGALALATACAKAPPRPPEAGTMVYYRIPWPDAFPSDVVVTEDGRLWFTDRLTHAIGVFDPATSSFRRIPTPTEQSAPYGFTRGPDGALWFGESNGGRLGRIDPETDSIHEVEVGLAHGPQLLAWADDALWFTSRRDDAVGRYDPATGDIRIWREPLPGRRVRYSGPYGIAATPDGRVWVGRHGGSHLYRVDALPDTGTVVDYTEPSPVQLSPEALERLSPETVERFRNRRIGMGMRRVAAGPDGRLWVAGHGRSRVVGMAPDGSGKRILATLDRRSQPYGVTVDPWGRVWYSEQGTDAIVVYDPVADDRRRMALPLEGGTVRDLVVDSERGRVWLPMSDIGAIAVIELEPPAP